MAANKKNPDTWSPYGHEPARRALLSQRRAQIIIAAIAIALLYAFFLNLTISKVEDPTGGTTTVDQADEQEPVTVTVRPGQMAEYVNAQTREPDGRPPPRPVYEQQQNRLVETAKPFLALIAPLAAAFWLLSRVGTSARGKLAELNLGVYKGAMPYELHVARAQRKVFTYRQVDAHVFGKAREDFLFGTYLGAPPLAVRRLLGEPIEQARVRSLKRSGTARVRVGPAAPAAPTGPLAAAAAAVRGWAAPLLARLPGRDPRVDRVRALRRRQGHTTDRSASGE